MGHCGGRGGGAVCCDGGSSLQWILIVVLSQSALASPLFVSSTSILRPLSDSVQVNLCMYLKRYMYNNMDFACNYCTGVCWRKYCICAN